MSNFKLNFLNNRKKSLILLIIISFITKVYSQIEEEQAHQEDIIEEFNLVPTREVFNKIQLSNILQYYDEPNKIYENLTIQELIGWALDARYHTSAHTDRLYHRYSSKKDLLTSGGPNVNNKKCIQQLEELVDRSERVSESYKYESNDTNIYQLLDTFGRPPAGLLEGRVVWLGNYEKCLKTEVKFDQTQHNHQISPTRYCLASLKFKSWLTNSNKTSYDEIRSLQTAVCLPKSCDSQDYKNKFELIQRLVDFNLREMDKSQLELTYLYCLPDSQSPLVDLSQSKVTMLWVTIFVSWFFFLIYCTLQTNWDYHTDALCHKMSITNNFYHLMKMEDRVEASEEVGKKEPRIVNFSVIDGIKVLGMVHVIMGHTMVALCLVLANGRDLSRLDNWTYNISNLMPAFSVNSFFVMTGILNGYYLLKMKKTNSLIVSTSRWISIFLNRYLRIMPAYMLAVVYTKYLAKYTGSGPLWDYATSVLSPRRICEQESWFLTLFMTANTVQPMKLCIISAWYLPNDFQFLLLTPIFIYLLRKYQDLGKSILNFIITFSIFLSFISIYDNEQAQDLRAVGRFMPNSFQTNVHILSEVYVRFQYRLPSYIIGIIIGYEIYRFEKTRIVLDEIGDLAKYRPESVRNSYYYKEMINAINGVDVYSNTLITTSLIYFLFLHRIGRLLPHTIWSSKFSVAILTPLLYTSFAYTVGSYISMAAVKKNNKNFMDRFFSAPIWKPLSRLNLCALLVNFEVIIYFAQTSHRMLDLTSFNHFIIVITAIIITYLVAAVMYILIEAPIKNLIDFYLHKKEEKDKKDKN